MQACAHAQNPFSPWFETVAYVRLVPASGAVEELGALDHHEMRGEVDSPGERGGANQDLDLFVAEELLHQRAVRLSQPGVMHADAKGERVPQVGVLHLRAANESDCLRACSPLCNDLEERGSQKFSSCVLLTFCSLGHFPYVFWAHLRRD